MALTVDTSAAGTLVQLVAELSQAPGVTVTPGAATALAAEGVTVSEPNAACRWLCGRGAPAGAALLGAPASPLEQAQVAQWMAFAAAAAAAATPATQLAPLNGALATRSFLVAQARARSIDLARRVVAITIDRSRATIRRNVYRMTCCRNHASVVTLARCVARSLSPRAAAHPGRPRVLLRARARVRRARGRCEGACDVMQCNAEARASRWRAPLTAQHLNETKRNETKRGRRRAGSRERQCSVAQRSTDGHE